MADKRVTISVGPESDPLNLPLLHVTEVKESEEIDSDTIPTFDEPVNVPSTDGGYTIDISLLEVRSVDDFITLKRIIKRMKTEEGTVSVYEDIKHRDGNFLAERHYGGVILSSNEVTVSAEDLTARDLSFKARVCSEKVNDTEI